MLYLLGTEKVRIYRGIEQLVARRAHNPEVVGSSPSPATKPKTLEITTISRVFTIVQKISKEDLI